MKYFFAVALFTGYLITLGNATLCGCKQARPCYQEMIDDLLDRDEAICIEDASIGASAMMIYLKALKEYCPNIIDVNMENETVERRALYEVVITAGKDVERTSKEEEEEAKPVFIIEAGQAAGHESVGFAMFIIEQLVACEEQHEMIDKFKWVILPSTNPDGMEHARFNRVLWKKNVRPLEDGLGFGVDITRNFNDHFMTCGLEESIFSQVYQGPTAASENETLFVQNIISKYKKDAKLYVSIRRDGHAIMFPDAHAETKTKCKSSIELAAKVATKVNQRGGGVQLFLNDTIYNINGKPHCGHSVDYAAAQGIPFCYEMRVFLGEDNRIVEKFQVLPKGYEHSLRLGYLSGIREMFNYFKKKTRRFI